MTPEQTLAVAVVAGAGLAPMISVRFISARYLDAARDVWLLGLGWVAAFALCLYQVPLGLIALAVLLHWKSWAQLPAVITWAGIIGTWALVQALPSWAVDALPWGWRITVGYLLLFAFYQKRRKHEVKATTGTRIMLAALLAMTWPFASVYEYPLYAYGLWLTSSWVALGAALIGAVVRYPATWPYAAAGLAVVVALWIPAWTRHRTIDQTPRGGSLDGWRVRWRTWTVMVRLATRWPIWLIGAGPQPADRRLPSLERDLAREATLMSRTSTVPLLTTPTHCEPLELAYCYGLLGIASMLTLAWQIIPRLALGDPWSASLFAGFVIACAAIPARVAPVGLVWLIVLAVVAGR